MTFIRMIVTSTMLALGGCTGVATHGCFVGFSLFPPSPVILCGLDVESPKDKDE